MALLKSIDQGGLPYTYHRVGDITVKESAPLVRFVLESYRDASRSGPPIKQDWVFPMGSGDLLACAYCALLLSPQWINAQSDGQGSGQALAMAVPVGSASWDSASGVWVATNVKTLASAKADAWAAVKAKRAEVLVSPLMTPHGTFDCSPQSQDNIMRAYLFANKLAELGLPSEMQFTLADNTRPSFSVQQITAVAIAMGAREKQAYDLAATLRTQIDAAQTIEEAEVIKWPQN
jgi:hypothetical protein